MDTSLEKTLYHSFLRVAVCVVAFALVFDSGLLFKTTSIISNTAQQHLASVVGVSVGVAPNEVNQLTARITELETELEAKERLIAVNVRDNSAGGGIDKSTFLLSIILFILLVLIVLNYALDFARTRRIKTSYEESTSQMA
jgi:hypothetical protein